MIEQNANPDARPDGLNPDTPTDSGCFRVGSVHVDLSARRLSRGRRAVSVTPKAIRVLELLIRASPGVVSRTEVLDRVWPNVVVSESILTDAVRTLRRAFRQLGIHEQVIETIPRTGYCLICPVEAASAKSNQKIGQPLIRKIAFGGALAAVAAVMIWVFDLVSPGGLWPQSQNYNQQVYYQRGRQFYERYRPEDNLEAIKIFSAGLRERPEDPLLMSGLAEAYLQQYDAYGLEFEWAEKGISMAEKALERGPELSPVQRAAGLAAAVAGNRDSAKSHYRRAVELDPSNRQAMGNPGLSIPDRSRHSERLAAVQVGPRTGSPLGSGAHVYRHQLFRSRPAFRSKAVV